MEYLKYFESKDSHIKEDLEDIFLELSDIGFNIRVWEIDNEYIVHIQKHFDYNSRYKRVDVFTYGDVGEVVKRAKDYLRGFTCEISVSELSGLDGEFAFFKKVSPIKKLKSSDAIGFVELKFVKRNFIKSCSDFFKEIIY